MHLQCKPLKILENSKNQSINVSARGIEWHVLHIPTVHQVWRVLKAKMLLLLQEASWISSWLLGCQQGRDILSVAAAATPPDQGQHTNWWRYSQSQTTMSEVDCLALLSNNKITLYNPCIHFIQENKTQGGRHPTSPLQDFKVCALGVRAWQRGKVLGKLTQWITVEKH